MDLSERGALERTNVLVIGAGPIGIELAVELSRRGVAYVHLEAGQIGATVAWYPPGMQFHSPPEKIAIAGVPFRTADQLRGSREDYLLYLRTVVEEFDLDVRTFERVVAITRVDDGFQVRSRTQTGDRTYLAASLVLAIGGMHSPRSLIVAGEDLPHVSHYLKEPHVYFRRRVLVVGGRNSAVEAVLRCYRVGARVALSYRGAELEARHVKYWLLPEITQLIEQGRIAFFPSSVPVEIRPDAAVLRQRRGPRSDTVECPADHVLLMTGYNQDATLFDLLGVELAGPERRPVLDPETMETTVRGVFVAGTAIAGSQMGTTKVIIEACHVHVDRIVSALVGRKPVGVA